MKSSVPGLVVLALAVSGCVQPSREERIVDAQSRYLAAMAACVGWHPDSLAAQADCRTNAANTFIRPYYRYGDLMTRIQRQRKGLAIKVDEGRMTRAAYDRQIAQLERAVAREEARRNQADR